MEDTAPELSKEQVMAAKERRSEAHRAGTPGRSAWGYEGELRHRSRNRLKRADNRDRACPQCGPSGRRNNSAAGVEADRYR